MKIPDATEGTEGQTEGAPASTAATPPAASAPAAAPEASAPAPVAPLSFGQRLAAAAASLNGKGTSAEVESLRGQLAAVTGERDALQGQLKAAADKISGLEKDLAAANARVAEAESALTDFEKKVARSSIDLVAAAGVPVTDLPAAEASGTSSGVPATRAELEEKMKGLSTADAVSLLRKFNASHGNN